MHLSVCGGATFGTGGVCGIGESERDTFRGGRPHIIDGADRSEPADDLKPGLGDGVFTKFTFLSSAGWLRLRACINGGVRATLTTGTTKDRVLPELL